MLLKAPWAVWELTASSSNKPCDHCRMTSLPLKFLVTISVQEQLGSSGPICDANGILAAARAPVIPFKEADKCANNSHTSKR
mmetsp:Transcript_83380/g.139128  ORF Transcript_83380/g.139128 Transcript_83380/m.139128 type:complete len:82 (+) Transcript_83380:72-317(+)